MNYLITGGRIITATDDFFGDVLVEGETITAVGPALEAPDGVERIDATGKYVFPGFIDPHVHVYLPFMGTQAADTHETASRAALVGGTTTFIEMCCPANNEQPLEAFELWLEKAQTSSCDYTFHMGVSRFDQETRKQFEEIVKRGVASLKVFLAYKGAFSLSEEELYETLTFAKQYGLIVTAHCENAELIAKRQAELIGQGKTGPEWHEPSRPTYIEAEGVGRLMTYAETTGAHVYCVHTSCSDALEAVQTAQLRDVNVWVEVVLPHLVFDRSYAELPGFEGAKFVMSPPLREARHQEAMWNALRSRLVSTVGTDHAPFNFQGQKEMGRDDFTKIPNGIPSIENRVEVLYSEGVGKGRIDLNTFVDSASTQAAKLFGLYPRKGTIAVGSDADVVIFDPNAQREISQATHQMAVDYSAFEGWQQQGGVEHVLLRGTVKVRDGKFVGEPGTGEFLTREPTHF
ncbi:dihydropyrimidinase [Adhaeretor mobilis]|uniref:D-hydantoinase n=1 Tax=Adhaeretor mobilis TaxID=1930276 RepID=A0A517MVN3_9BACT|nr:dihydropyrimidinase [Adhaeretor mobilis]QDS98938.1 D-hydantoinase [Adhaeretor mobilis]